MSCACGKARTTLASVDIVLLDGTAQQVVSEIKVRDVLIAGMGDSIAAGEGNPDRAVRLSDEGFCYRSFGGFEYYRPGRAGFTGNKACGAAFGDDTSPSDWARQSALDQRRLPPFAVQLSNAHRARARGRERASRRHLHPARLLRRHHQYRLPRRPAGARVPEPGRRCGLPGSVRSQIAELKDVMAMAQRQRADRTLDAVLLTIGANDIHFSGLIADVIVEAATERALLNRGGAMASVEDAQGARSRSARQFLEGAFRTQAAGGRQPGTRRVRDLRQSRARGARHTVPRRARWLRRASRLRSRYRPPAPGRGLRLAAVLAGDQGARQLRGRPVLP